MGVFSEMITLLDGVIFKSRKLIELPRFCLRLLLGVAFEVFSEGVNFKLSKLLESGFVHGDVSTATLACLPGISSGLFGTGILDVDCGGVRPLNVETTELRFSFRRKLDIGSILRLTVDTHFVGLLTRCFDKAGELLLTSTCTRRLPLAKIFDAVLLNAKGR